MCAIIGFTSPRLKKEQVLPYFEKTKSRGPDDTRMEPAGSGLLGFHRLAIMGLQPEGMQPFQLGHSYVVCNGEIYGFERIRAALQEKGYTFESAEIEMVPQNYITMTSEDDVRSMTKLLDMLDDNEDVQNVWHNWQQD